MYAIENMFLFGFKLIDLDVQSVCVKRFVSPQNHLEGWLYLHVTWHVLCSPVRNLVHPLMSTVGFNGLLGGVPYDERLPFSLEVCLTHFSLANPVNNLYYLP